jgi:hypothetical protein
MRSMQGSGGAERVMLNLAHALKELARGLIW